MTTIAVRYGIMAADSRVSYESENAGSIAHPCEKIYRKAGAIIGLAGESAPGLVFLDWYASGRARPEILVHGEADFTAIVLTGKGLFEYDKWCRGEKVMEPYYAIGSGRKAAMAAMDANRKCTAKRAVQIACKRDLYSALPVVTMRLRDR